MEINKEMYNSPHILDIKNKLPAFHFGDESNDGKDRVVKPIILLENGAKYEGEWLNGTDTRDGRGIQIWLDGSRYEGYWKDDLQHGMGKEIWTDNSMYEGLYQDGKKHGKGFYVWADGSTYDGTWI